MDDPLTDSDDDHCVGPAGRGRETSFRCLGKISTETETTADVVCMCTLYQKKN